MLKFTIIDFFKLGGVFMWPLLLFSIIGIAFIIERAYYIFIKMDLRTKVENIKLLFEKLSSKDIQAATKELENADANNLSISILKTGFSVIPYGLARVEKTIEDITIAKIKELERGLNVFVVIGNLAPLTGFLGTVSGMITAFKSIALAEEVSVQLVAAGIYEALITTVVGLVIAIIVTIAHNVFTIRIDNFLNDIEVLSDKLTQLLIQADVK